LERKASSVEHIIAALSELESDVDNLNSRVEEMKKRIMVYSNEEIDRLKQQIISIANDEAKKIIYSAKTEAEAESSVILEESDKTLGNIKKNIDDSYNKAVKGIIQIILGENAGAGTAERKGSENKITESAAKIKKITPDEK